MKNAIHTAKLVQLTAGRGPAECCWVVAKVLKVFLEECKDKGISYEIVHREPGQENGTQQSATIRISGLKTIEFLATWVGTIQWIGSSSFRKYHKRKNWFIGMFQLELPSEIKIDMKQVKFQAMRSSGPGGQHVNKVSSAIRAIHIPTGIQVVVMESRSQHQNRKLAISRLSEKMQEEHTQELKKQAINQWENHLDLQRGNPIRVFKGGDFKQQKKVKTHKSTRQKVKNDLKKKLWD